MNIGNVGIEKVRETDEHKYIKKMAKYNASLCDRDATRTAFGEECVNTQKICTNKINYYCIGLHR